MRRLNEKYRNGFDTTPKSTRFIEENIGLNERKLALCGLILSVLVIIVKLLSANYDAIERVVLERKLISYEVLSEDGRVMFTNSWRTAVRYSNFWLPPLYGFLTTYITWIFVYLDSHIPGVYPPSPLSPQKYKVQSGHTFHLNYVFALLMGILVTSYMYFRGASIEY